MSSVSCSILQKASRRQFRHRTIFLLLEKGRFLLLRDTAQRKKNKSKKQKPQAQTVIYKATLHICFCNVNFYKRAGNNTINLLFILEGYKFKSKAGARRSWNAESYSQKTQPSTYSKCCSTENETDCIYFGATPIFKSYHAD